MEYKFKFCVVFTIIVLCINYKVDANAGQIFGRHSSTKQWQSGPHLISPVPAFETKGDVGNLDARGPSPHFPLHLKLIRQRHDAYEKQQQLIRQQATANATLELLKQGPSPVPDSHPPPLPTSQQISQGYAAGNPQFDINPEIPLVASPPDDEYIALHSSYPTRSPDKIW